MNRVAFAVVSLALMLPLLSAPARGELCTIDAVPAATLLLPYFEIDLAKLPRFTKVEQTVISIQNATAAPAIAHVTLWSDLSVPTLAFDVLLTGYDVEEINLTELFHTGGISGLQVAPGATGFVLGTTPAGGLQNRGDLIKAHRGEAVDGKCYGRPVNRNVARGYVTIDNVDALSTLFPGDSEYFERVANDVNGLWGFVLTKSRQSLQADLLVHIEAASGKFAAGDYTFYGRYVGFDGSDGREPLPNQWAARYESGSERTELIAWRDSGVRQRPFTCSQLGQAGWYPLLQSEVVVFNKIEDAIEPFLDPVDGSELPSVPAEAQRIPIASGAFDVSPFESGWLYLNLNVLNGRAQLQSYIGVRQILGKRTAVYPGMPYLFETTCARAPARTLAPIP